MVSICLTNSPAGMSFRTFTFLKTVPAGSCSRPAIATRIESTCFLRTVSCAIGFGGWRPAPPGGPPGNPEPGGPGTALTIVVPEGAAALPCPEGAGRDDGCG